MTRRDGCSAVLSVSGCGDAAVTAADVAAVVAAEIPTVTCSGGDGRRGPPLQQPTFPGCARTAKIQTCSCVRPGVNPWRPRDNFSARQDLRSLAHGLCYLSAAGSRRRPPLPPIAMTTLPEIDFLVPLHGRIGPGEDRRVWLERLAFALSGHCPFDGSNPPDCPLHGLRALGEGERLEWLSLLSDDELEYLAAYHLCCISEKMRTLEEEREEARRAARLEEPGPLD